MTKLQKIGLIVAIISAVLWLIGLCIGLYADFDKGDQVLAIPVEGLNTDGGLQYGMNYFIYYGLIAIFAVGVGLILEECSRKSLKKSLIVLGVSCLLGWLFWSLSIRYFATLCAGCTDYIAYGFGFLFLMFLALWFISCFFAIKNLTNNKKKAIIITLIVLGLACAIFVWFGVTSDYLMRGLTSSLKVMFLLFLIISIIVCIMVGIKGHKEAKKSS